MRCFTEHKNVTYPTEISLGFCLPDAAYTGIKVTIFLFIDTTTIWPQPQGSPSVRLFTRCSEASFLVCIIRLFFFSVFHAASVHTDKQPILIIPSAANHNFILCSNDNSFHVHMHFSRGQSTSVAVVVCADKATVCRHEVLALDDATLLRCVREDLFETVINVGEGSRRDKLNVNW